MQPALPGHSAPGDHWFVGRHLRLCPGWGRRRERHPLRVFTSEDSGRRQPVGGEPGQPGLTEGRVGPPARHVDKFGRAGTADHDGGAGGDAVARSTGSRGWRREE